MTSHLFDPTPASVADIQQVLEWAAELYRHDAIAFDRDSAERALRELIGDARLGRVWLLRSNGQALGYMVVTLGYSIEYGGRDAIVDELFVIESQRGHGVGTRALEFAAEECQSLGIRALHLEVKRANMAAQRVYRAAGFVDHERYFMTRLLV